VTVIQNNSGSAVTLLEVIPYQLDTPCQGYNAPYKGSIQGWKDGMLKIEQSFSKKKYGCK
jgi:hypothetical protein